MIAKDFAQQLFDLHDRVAFVTGAGSGIGQMIALALASAGARVVCFDLREDGGLKETVNHIEALGGQALYIRAMFSMSGGTKTPGNWDKTCHGRAMNR